VTDQAGKPSDQIPAILPEHLAAAQLLINRCATPEMRKALIVAIACHGAIEAADAELLIQANQLETA
jgi:hypothetical protein